MLSIFFFFFFPIFCYEKHGAREGIRGTVSKKSLLCVRAALSKHSDHSHRRGQGNLSIGVGGNIANRVPQWCNTVVSCIHDQYKMYNIIVYCLLSHKKCVLQGPEEIMATQLPRHLERKNSWVHNSDFVFLSGFFALLFFCVPRSR